jgi:arsenate reductase-like glutaredoxin family protein
MAALAGGAANLAATKGKSFKDLNTNLGNPQELIPLMSKEPKLLKRPLLWRGAELVVGFNEEKYRELLDHGQ